jgi:hypothetical protein
MTVDGLSILDQPITRAMERIAARLSGVSLKGGWPAGAAAALLAREAGDVSLPDVQSLGPPWPMLADHLALTGEEVFVLLAAAAPDLDPRYATLFAMLHDDATLPWFSADIARQLGGPAGRAADPDHRLRRERLLIPLVSGESQRCRDRQPLRAHPHLVTLLRGEWPSDAETAVLPRLAGPSAGALSDLDTLMAMPQERPLVLLVGADRTWQRDAVRDLMGRLGRSLVIASVPSTDTADHLANFVLLARIYRAGLLLNADAAPPAGLVSRLAHGSIPVFLAVGNEAAWLEALGPDAAVVVIRDPDLAPDERQLVWCETVAAAGLAAKRTDLDRAARRFRLGHADIGRAVRALRQQAIRGHSLELGGDMIMAAAAATRRVAFGSLASKLQVRSGWDALVLPERTADALRDLAGAMEFGSKVFGDWGFGDIGRGRRGGVTALFAGASGTGKTMAAGLVAATAGFDVWRIDLSGLVSKYIGETEKNLEKIFSAARDSDAALFFDEADAIFGARSEVKDAHDRYANIETAYLLQRLEDHEGPVILASNIASNIDQAFLRRLDFVIEFPIPDATLRAELWRRSLPAAAPLGADIDIAFLARQFVLAGGDIRSATLDAAFRAARLGTPIDMAALLRAVGRQMAKHGRVPSLAEFGRYRPLVEAAE